MGAATRMASRQAHWRRDVPASSSDERCRGLPHPAVSDHVRPRALPCARIAPHPARAGPNRQQALPDSWNASPPGHAPTARPFISGSSRSGRPLPPSGAASSGMPPFQRSLPRPGELQSPSNRAVIAVTPMLLVPPLIAESGRARRVSANACVNENADGRGAGTVVGWRTS